MESNPYLNGKKKQKLTLFLQAPMYDFESPERVEAELGFEELCIARIPNTAATGYTHHVALVYRDSEGKVYSLTMAQHHGDIKSGTIDEIKQAEKPKKFLFF